MYKMIAICSKKIEVSLSSLLYIVSGFLVIVQIKAILCMRTSIHQIYMTSTTGRLITTIRHFLYV